MTEALPRPRWPEWDAFLRTVPEGRLRQTSHYAAGLQLYGWEPSVLVLRNRTLPGEPIVAGALIGEKKLPMVGGARLQVSGGLAIDPSLDLESVDTFLRALDAHGRERGAAWIQLEWRRPYSIGEAPTANGERERALLVESGYLPLEPSGTYFISLEGKTRESLLASLGRQARQNIRHALRDGVEVVEEQGADGVETFRDFHREMSERKGLGTWPDGFDREVLGSAIAAGAARLYCSRHEGKRINMILVSTVGAPLYEWGAIAPRDDSGGAPPTGELLHYEAMCRALDGAHAFYDLGGSPGPEPIPEHPNYSVWRFKKKLGGEFVWFVGEGKRVLVPWKAKAIDLLRRRGTPA